MSDGHMSDGQNIIIFECPKKTDIKNQARSLFPIYS